MESRAVKWWGWGWEDRSRPVEGLPVLWRYVQERLKLDSAVRRVPPIEQVRIPPSLLSPDELTEIEKLVGEGNLSVEHEDRVAPGGGRRYKDIVRLRAGNLYRAPA
ncbi:MAG: hypothetical protein AABX97_03390, partial [Candidatus Thermoplasmatota archaeon]